MNVNDIKEYAQRDWAKISELDQVYWAEKYQRHGSETGRQAAGDLWQHMKSIRPEWPDASERNADLQHHIRFKQLLEQASNGLAPG